MFLLFHFPRGLGKCAPLAENKIKNRNKRNENKKKLIPNLVFLKKYLFMEKSEKLFNISLANDFPWLLFFFFVVT